MVQYSIRMTIHLTLCTYIIFLKDIVQSSYLQPVLLTVISMCGNSFSLGFTREGFDMQHR